MSLKSFWKSSSANKLIVVVALIWAALAVVFGIYDLEISKFLFNASNPVGKLVGAFGEIPGILFGLFALFTFWGGSNFKSKSNRAFVFLGEVVVSTFLFYYILKLIFNYTNFDFKFNSLLGITLGFGLVLLSLICLYTFKLKYAKFSKKNYLFAKLSVILFVVAGAIVEILKVLWGRMRYEDVVLGVGKFTAWYLPQGITGNSSFPSGHAYLGWILIPLFLIFLNKNKIWKWILIILTSIFGLFISFERIVAGAHYASDVLFSGGIVIILFLILYHKYFLKSSGKK